MTTKTRELTGAALDWAVATIEGYGGLRRNPHTFDQSLIMNRKDGQCVLFSTLKYSTNWSQGGPIIEREVIVLTHPKWDCWTAQTQDSTDPEALLHGEDGPTPLIAAMRCYVASKLGDEVEIPDDLG